MARSYISCAVPRVFVVALNLIVVALINIVYFPPEVSMADKTTQINQVLHKLL